MVTEFLKELLVSAILEHFDVLSSFVVGRDEDLLDLIQICCSEG